MDAILLQLGISGTAATYILGIVGTAILTGGAVSWHTIRKACSDNHSADQVCEQANKDGVPIVYEGKQYDEWNTW